MTWAGDYSNFTRPSSKPFSSDSRTGISVLAFVQTTMRSKYEKGGNFSAFSLLFYDKLKGSSFLFFLFFLDVNFNMQFVQLRLRDLGRGAHH